MDMKIADDEINRMSDRQLQHLESQVKKDLKTRLTQAQERMKIIPLELQKLALRRRVETEHLGDSERYELEAQALALEEEMGKQEQLAQDLKVRVKLYRGVPLPQATPIEMVRR